MPRLLALDTATEQMSLALVLGDAVHVVDAPGGARASAALLPAVLALLAEAGTTLRSLDAIAFGRGPGAFTGLRTACAAAQGLALGAERPVLPLDTLAAVAEDASPAGAHGDEVWVAMDARMDEVYAGRYRHAAGRWQAQDGPMLTRCELLAARWAERAPRLVAGSALGAFGERLPTGAAALAPGALPRGRALAALARSAWAAGEALDAALALPLYLRDKVAQTTAERAALAAAKRSA